MANPTEIGVSDNNPAVLLPSTTEASVTLDPDRTYSIGHDGEDETGTADTNTVYLSTSSSVDADASEGANKAKLINGRSITIGPGVSALYFKTASGGPTMTVQPGERLNGAW